MPLIQFPLKSGWWLSLGLQPLNLVEWLVIDRDFRQQMTLKQQLWHDRPDQVFASLPQSIAAQQEVLDLLLAHLLQVYPQHYRQQGTRLHNCLTGQTWDVDASTPPLALAGQLVQEDWCVLLPQDGEYRLAAGSVCFPFRWRLQDKLGRSLTHIHAPVPGYAEKLARPVNSVFDRLRPDYPSVRSNWGIVDTPDPFLPASHSEAAFDPTITLENAGDRLWLRVERQTLRRLPQTKGILFGIQTTIEPLHRIKADPVIACHLADAIEQPPVSTQIYKSLLPLQSILLPYLRG